MKPLLFVTGNNVKFRWATSVCDQYDVPLQQVSLDIPEIQASDGEIVARDKALRIFEEFQKPIVISDDTWMIPAIKNFPGPYMKFVNQTFTSTDWLRLTKPLADRTIILRQYVVYQDKNRQEVFHKDIEGVLLTEARGTTAPYPHTHITSFDGGKTTIAEGIERGTFDFTPAGKRTTWHDFCEWLIGRQK